MYIVCILKPTFNIIAQHQLNTQQFQVNFQNREREKSHHTFMNAICTDGVAASVLLARRVPDNDSLPVLDSKDVDLVDIEDRRN